MAHPGSVPTTFMGSGVKQDIHLLFNKFSALNSVRIQDFAEAFRELNFSTILQYRLSPSEYTEFAEYLLQNAALYFGKDNEVGAKRSFTERVFGIYLCYALYNMQPADHVCQIPITELQFKDLTEFQDVLAATKSLEAITALKQLFLRKAFRMMMFQSTYDPSTHRKYLAEDEMPDFGREPVEPFAAVKSVQTSRALGEIACIHNAYVAAKKKLGLTDIQLVDKMNPVDQINQHIEKHQKQLEEMMNGGRVSNQAEQIPESAGTSRSNLRSRAYAAKMQHTRHRRHLDPNMEENFKHLTFGQIALECLAETSVPGPSTETAPVKPKAPKRKRTVKQEPGQLDDDEIAAETLRMEYAARVKPELPEVTESTIGGKQGKQGTSGVAKIRAPPKRKDGNLIVVKTERREDTTHVPTASEMANFNSLDEPGEKKKRKKTAAPKPKISDEWSGRLTKWSGQLQSTDKELKKLTSSIKIEEVDDDDI